MPRRKFDTTQRGISDTHTDAPIATSICENKLVYAERIRTLRAAANLSQGELAEAMNLGRAAISNWETGRTRPDIANIPRLCNVLGITVAAFFSDTPEEAGWNDAERALMRNYRKLSAINQDLLSATAQTMVALEEQYPGLPKRPAAPKLTPEPARLDLLELPYADDSVAAGTGDSGFAASGHTTFLHATHATRGADMVFRVNGDSMEPKYPDHCNVLVKFTDEPLGSGDIGIFQVDGALYIKQYQSDGLHSLNKHFKSCAASPTTKSRPSGASSGFCPTAISPQARKFKIFRHRKISRNKKPARRQLMCRRAGAYCVIFAALPGRKWFFVPALLLNIVRHHCIRIVLPRFAIVFVAQNAHVAGFHPQVVAVRLKADSPEVPPTDG